MQVLLMVLLCFGATFGLIALFLFAGNISVDVMSWAIFGLMIILILGFAFNWKKFCYKMPDPEGMPEEGEIIEGEIVE